MILSREITDKLKILDHARTEDPFALITAIGEDPVTFFDYGEWRDLDFSPYDMSAVTFFQARVIGCTFQGGDISEHTRTSCAVFSDNRFIENPQRRTDVELRETYPYTAEKEQQNRLRIISSLDIVQQQFLEGRKPTQIIDRAVQWLHETRRKYHPNVWQDLIPIVQNHPVADFFHQDPFTRWSFMKPRGYSGDAQLIDFIYGHPSVSDEIAEASPLGKELYGYTSQSPSSVAVRERRDLLTRYVDEIATEKGAGTEILTMSAGHLREADNSVALREKRIKRWVALDQDPLSVGSMVRDFNGTCVEAIDGSVRGLLTKSHALGKFDFVYAAGLYDYLADKVAIKLTQTCLDMLKPNGVFLFANFSRDVDDDGYMETFMNWALLLRSEVEMWNIINASVERNSVDAHVEFGANRHIVYGVIRKRS